MNAVRQVVNSNSLDGVITLPKFFQNKDVEVVVTLMEEPELPVQSKSDISSMLVGSVTEVLTGIIPHTNTSLDKYRSERLSKYESAD